MSSHSPSRSAASSAGTVNERECAVCGKRAPCRPVRSLRPSLVRKLQEHGLAANSPHAAVCTLCLSSALSKHTLDVVKHRKKGELPEVEKELTARATEIADEIERGVPDSLGLRAADAVARIGGSWGFVLGFMMAIACWTVMNSLVLGRGFDPYPYILLNLVLSCLASIQAPIILMSQSRMAQVDRIRATEDFRINMNLSLEGIGASLSNEDGYTVIQELIPGGAASKSAKDATEAAGANDDGVAAPKARKAPAKKRTATPKAS